MKQYLGTRDPDSGCEVYVVTKSGHTYLLPMHTQIRNHSPSGFEWGYGGSGPAQLALAILADYFGPAKPPDKCPYCDGGMHAWKCVNERDCGYNGVFDQDQWKHIQAAPIHYQQFKQDIIAKLPRVGAWVITSEQVAAWVTLQAYRQAATPQPQTSISP